MRLSSMFALGLASVAILAVGCTAILGDVEPTSGPAGTGGNGSSVTSGNTITSSSSAAASSGSGGEGGAGGQSVASSAATAAGGGGGKLDCSNVTPNPAEPTSCNECANANCCADVLGCQPGSQCNEVAFCELMCNPADTGCIMACSQANPSGALPLLELELCVLNKCPAQGCTIPGYPVCDSGFLATPQPCAECAGTMCCSQVKACTADPVCLACVFNEPGCDDANAAYKAYSMCIPQCGSSCI